MVRFCSAFYQRTLIIAPLELEASKGEWVISTGVTSDGQSSAHEVKRLTVCFAKYGLHRNITLDRGTRAGVGVWDTRCTVDGWLTLTIESSSGFSVSSSMVKPVKYCNLCDKLMHHVLHDRSGWLLLREVRERMCNSNGALGYQAFTPASLPVR